MQPELNHYLRQLLSKPGARIHLIGVAGSGMSGLARLLIQLGHHVSGSDLNRSAEVGRLEALGLKFFKGHEGSNVAGANLVVYSSAIVAANPERKAAVKSGIHVARRAECLAMLTEHKQSLVVAGMHGKTTTSSMLAWVLRSADWRCAHYIGAEVPILGASAAWDEGHHFVVEGDESDGTISLYHPHASMILNVEEEHLDYYGSLDEILRTFAQLIEQTTGPVLYCADDKNAVLLCSHHAGAIGYGCSEHANYRIIDVHAQNFSSTFKLLKNGVLLGDITLNVPGKQNVRNAAGVAALATELGVEWQAIVDALGEFRGAKRRFEVKYVSQNFMVVDDYAHHPTEIVATLAAAHNSGWKRVIALFQPHRYTRTKLLLEDFGPAFKDASRVYLTEIYAASEQPLEGVSGESLAAVVRDAGHAQVEFESSLVRLRRLVSHAIEPGDLVITLGAGDIHRVATKLAEDLAAFEALRKELKPESVLLREEPLSKHTSLRVGGPADLWFEPVDEEDLAKGLKHAHKRGVPVTVIGRGTNLLVRDGGIRGLCIHLGQAAFNQVTVDGVQITAGAGVRLKTIVAEAKKHGLGGLEFMEGIPGNLGGALRMNAGAMQGWTMEVVEEIRSMNYRGEVQVEQRDNLEVRYRSVPHFEQNIALSAKLRGTPSAPQEITERLKKFSEKRWSSQPAAPSAGCIFKNPETIPAGKLVDELGLKNRAIGKARVSVEHGNFIVNDGGATSKDMLALIEVVKAEALEKRQIELETEVIVIGEDL